MLFWYNYSKMQQLNSEVIVVYIQKLSNYFFEQIIYQLYKNTLYKLIINKCLLQITHNISILLFYFLKIVKKDKYTNTIKINIVNYYC